MTPLRASHFDPGFQEKRPSKIFLNLKSRGVIKKKNSFNPCKKKPP